MKILADLMGQKKIFPKKLLKEANPIIWKILEKSPSIEPARQKIYIYLDKQEKEFLSAKCQIHPMEISDARESIRTLRQIISPKYEKITELSNLKTLYSLAKGKKIKDILPGFWLEFYFLFRGILANSGIYSYGTSEVLQKILHFSKTTGRESAILRSNFLDGLSAGCKKFLNRYPTGLSPEIIKKRKNNKKRILKAFSGTELDWNNWTWQLKHIIRKFDDLKDLIPLTSAEKKAILEVEKYHIPFGITPYYLSLMDQTTNRKLDYSIRAQVIPPLDYTREFQKRMKQSRELLDFMREADTSPIDLVTRRYAKIAILKPYNTCPQICVYCQRNYEIKGPLMPGSKATPEKLNQAITWFSQHPEITEVLITGGDPFVLEDSAIEYLLKRFSQMPHIERIRFGTRTFVTLPQRFTDSLINILKKYHILEKREICLVTHVQHPYEVTPEIMQVVQKIKKLGINIYNQQVFTTQNSRRFETVALKIALKSIGIDPYYTFNAKGKKETKSYRVPIARLLQERKEETRLFPGVVRTDEPVFNIPGMGKNHLRAMQDHDVVMIAPEGSRIYEFHPWEKDIIPVDPYYYEDVPIYDYLLELKKRGENLEDYKSIWYYY